MTNKIPVINEIFNIIKRIKDYRKEAKGLIKLAKNMEFKESHVIHLNRYFYLMSGLESKIKHRFCKEELTSIYSLEGIDIKIPSIYCNGQLAYKILSKD